MKVTWVVIRFERRRNNFLTLVWLLQNLRNIQAQIQYLTSKKDPTPQDTSLLQKLIEHHAKILATGKPVPTIPGQHAQGIPFVSLIDVRYARY